MGGLQAKSMTSQRYRAVTRCADMCYYGNVMTTTRWWICVTMETLWQQDGGYVTMATLWQQDGGYALLFYIFNSTVIDWTFVMYLLGKQKERQSVSYTVILQLECVWNVTSHGDAREGEVKEKMANGVGSQYSSHYLGTWCIQHY